MLASLLRSSGTAFLLALFLAAAPAAAQPEGVPQQDGALHDFLLRQQARGLLPAAHLSHRPLSAYEAERYLDSLDAHRAALPEGDHWQLDRFQGRAAGPGVGFVRSYVPFLYRNGEDFFSASGPDYAVQIVPLFYFSYGRARQTERAGREPVVPVWQNTRGVRVGGHIGDYVFFETRLKENQRRDAWPAFSEVGDTAPRLSNSRFVDSTTYDYFRAEGLVGVRTEHFEVRFGRDRNHFGPGQTSLVLSDYAPAYDQLQLRTTFWRIQYTNVFASMTDLTPLRGGRADRDLPNKFAAFHRLAFDLPAGVRLGLFESVIFAPDEDEQTRFDFEPAYLNPLIFYRAVERDLGSPDNVLLGADASWTAPLPGTPESGLKLYGQFMLDEFVADEIFTDSWRNKYGLLLGARLAGFPTELLALDDLSLTVEYARLRPYLYAHRDPSTSYTHYNDLLGHPAGPNAEDFALFARYRPLPRLEAALNVAYTRRGRAPTDSLGNEINVGADPLVSYTTRPGDEAPFLGGVRQHRWLVEARLGYELLPDLFLEATLRAESVDDAERGLNRYLAPALALRWGIPFRSARY